LISDTYTFPWGRHEQSAAHRAARGAVETAEQAFMSATSVMEIGIKA
jgi:PIN domain nuclease of toxin-antitoxin system